MLFLCALWLQRHYTTRLDMEAISGASTTLVATSNLQGHWHIGHWCSYTGTGPRFVESGRYGLRTRRAMMMMMILHKHDKPTQCCRAFTLALARLSCFYCMMPWCALLKVCYCCCFETEFTRTLLSNMPDWEDFEPVFNRMLGLCLAFGLGLAYFCVANAVINLKSYDVIAFIMNPRTRVDWWQLSGRIATSTVAVKYMYNFFAHHYIRQVNGVKLADILFLLLCVCMSVYWPMVAMTSSLHGVLR